MTSKALRPGVVGHGYLYKLKVIAQIKSHGEK